MLLPRSAVLCCLAVWATGCTGPPAAGPPDRNLLVISFDTTRADRLSAYGYAQPTSPAIDALAARGTLFTHAYSHTPSTLPTHASLFTGLLPPGHGVRANGRFRLSAEHDTLAERLRRHGFDTAAVVGALPVAQRFGLAQGFDLYDDDFAGGRRPGGVWLGQEYTGAFERPAEEVTDRALDWLARRGAKPWFLFAHYFDPHQPWVAPPPWTERFADPYDAEIAYADHHLGRLLEAAAALPGRTLIVFTGDHGEGLGEHGEEAHNRYLYNSTIRVPLVFALDGRVQAGAEVRTAVAHVDVLPTILELLGLEEVDERPGSSLAAALLDGTEPEPRPIYSETLEWKLGVAKGIVVRALIDGGQKLVRSDIEEEGGGYTVLELYDLETDPSETANRARSDATRRDRLARALASWTRALEENAFMPEDHDLDEETLEGLRSLGYLQ